MNMLAAVIATLALTHVLSAAPNERAFLLTLTAKPGSALLVRTVAPGWMTTVCYVRSCSVGEALIAIPARGKATFELHLYEQATGVTPARTVEVTAGPATLNLNV